MNAKSLIALVVVAVIAVGGAVWIASERSPKTDVSRNQALVPSLRGTVNDVTAVELIKGDEEAVATLKRSEHGWTVAEKNDYPADVRKVRDLLLGLADAEILEEKTSNPELYDRLGVEDVSKADASGVRVTLQGLAKPIAVIVGNYAPQAGNGTYVRRAGEAQSWLVSGNLAPQQDTKQWLDQVILDIPAERIQNITLYQPDGKKLTVAKDSREQASFTVLDVPPERELKSDTIGNTLGGALTALRLEDVQSVAALDPAAYQAVEIEYRTFDGLLIAATAFKAEGNDYVHFAVTFDQEQAERFSAGNKEEELEDSAAAAAEEAVISVETEEEARAAAASDQLAEAKETEAQTAPAPEPGETELATLREEAERLNARLSPWVYTIPSYQYDSMVKSMDDLLKPVAKEKATTPELPAGEPSGTE